MPYEELWPTVFVADRKGNVGYGWEGELNIKVQKCESTVRCVIDELEILADKPAASSR